MLAPTTSPNNPNIEANEGNDRATHDVVSCEKEDGGEAEEAGEADVAFMTAQVSVVQSRGIRAMSMPVTPSSNEPHLQASKAEDVASSQGNSVSAFTFYTS